MERSEHFGADMDSIPHQEEVCVSLSFPSELIEDFVHLPNIRTDAVASIQHEERPKGLPPADIQKKWGPSRNKLRKREERRLKKSEKMTTGPTCVWLVYKVSCVGP